jgi:predicted DNA-binding transcriptional regulator AlpA
MLQISVRTLWRLVSGKRIPEPVRLGAVVRWRSNDITNWIAAGCPNPAGRENNSRRT